MWAFKVKMVRYKLLQEQIKIICNSIIICKHFNNIYTSAWYTIIHHFWKVLLNKGKWNWVLVIKFCARKGFILGPRGENFEHYIYSAWCFKRVIEVNSFKHALLNSFLPLLKTEKESAKSVTEKLCFEKIRMMNKFQ